MKPGFLIINCLISITCFAQGETFVKRTIISGLNSPWEVTYGPNDSLWITETWNYLVKRVNVHNGGATTLLNISSLKNFSPGDGGRMPQGGLMGMALHPDLYSAVPSVRIAKPWVYIAYVYERTTGQNCSGNQNSSDPCYFKTRIVRYQYNGNALSGPVVLADNLPGSNDHNSGRLVIGPDLKLYYTIGDMGAGQFNNTSRTNNAQLLDNFEGKVLRINTESDGDAGADAWVPDDNPFYTSASITARDYVFTLGHRNAQGLAWGNVEGTNYLYSSEHGDKTDDEVNLIQSGKNYGWNRASGYCEGNYNGMTLGGYSPVNENTFASATATRQDPLFTMFTRTQAQINSLSSSATSWPTVAPSSIEFYGHYTIRGWRNSLLIPCLKAGRVYRIKLSASGTTTTPVYGAVDTISYFRGEGRFRDIAISEDGAKIYLACDASGQTSGPTGSFNGGGTPPPNAGSIVEFASLNGVLTHDQTEKRLLAQEVALNIFPNPATDKVNVVMQNESGKPFVLQLYSLQHTLISEIKTNTSVTALPMSRLREGVYIVQLKTTQGRLLATQKIIKL